MRWTREAIIEAVLDWERAHGRLPTSYDWNPAHAQAQGNVEVGRRFGTETWPSTASVRRRFGSGGRCSLRCRPRDPLGMRKSTYRLYVTHLAPREREALDLIRGRPGITVGELQEALGVGRKRVWQVVSRLQYDRIHVRRS